ncbi:helix-turn-helix domain-containing protein [Micromonospora matsumotoense]|uniref:helix-turn-helix domain-containing protein n=1 Tax=Micromonospora matsumotoense TaxID=121616 RepID=UPI003D917741
MDRLLATLVHLRHGLTHDGIATWIGVHRSTVSRSIAEISPLLADRGCRLCDGLRLPTLSDMVAHLRHHPQALTDATECGCAIRSRAKRARTGSCLAKPG